MKQFLAFLLFLSFGLSQSVVTIQDSEIEINENEAVVEVLGMVCSMCAFGIGEGFSKTDFVDKTKFNDGVSVDIDAQFVQVGLLKSSDANAEKQNLVLTSLEFYNQWHLIFPPILVTNNSS